jgi:hypothetical protein
MIKVHRSFVSLCLIAAGLLSTPAAFGQMINWTSRYAPNYVEIREVTFGQGLYVAVGDESTMLYSSDGVNWQNGNLPPGLSCNLKTVAYAFGQFFAGGVNLSNNQGVLLASMDGISWADVTDEFLSTADSKSGNFASLVSGRIEGIEYLATVVKRPNDYGDAVALTSNGSIWRDSGYGSRFQHFSIDRDGSMYVLSSNSGGYWSWSKLGVDSYGDPDLSSWGSIPFRNDLRNYAHGNGTYVGADAARRLAYANSASTVAFTNVTSPLISNYTGVAFGRDTFVAVGSSAAVVVSYDLGRKWNAVAGLGLQQITLNGVRFVGGKFIAYGGGRIVTGTPVNKRSWAESPLPNGTLALNGVATNGTVLVAVGARGQILYSTTGVVWQRTPPATSRALYRVDYDPVTKLFFATGEAGTLLRSRNGWNWVATPTGYGGYLYGVGRSGGRLVAGSGTAGRFISSTDGVRWQAGASSLLNFGRSFSDTGSTAFAFGANGRVARSLNGGATWQSLRAPANTLLQDLAVFGGNVFLAGSSGFLYRAPLANPSAWAPINTWTSLAFYGLPRNAQAARQIAAVGQMGAVYSQPAANRWRLEMLNAGRPVLTDAIKFKTRWVVVGSTGSSGFVATTMQN